MADDVDFATELNAAHLEKSISAARTPVPAGVAGECDECCEPMPRLRHTGATLMSTDAPAKGGKPVTISRELYDFLMGVGEIDGTSFGDLHDGLPGRFWWRALLMTADTHPTGDNHGE